jgi:hypothetical protein
LEERTTSDGSTQGEKGVAWHDAGSMNDRNIDVGLHIYARSPSNLNTVSKSPTVCVAYQIAHYSYDLVGLFMHSHAVV